MKKLQTVLLNMPQELKENGKDIILVGPISLSKHFALECMLCDTNLYNRIIGFMDDNYDGQAILERKVFKLSKYLQDDKVQYFIISSTDNGMFVMYKRMISFGIDDKNIFIQMPTDFITKEFMNSYDIDSFRIIECGAFGGTGQIFKMEKSLQDKIKIYAFEADSTEVNNLKNQQDSKYLLFNKIVDFKINNSRQLYRISSDGAWAFHKPNKLITDSYISIYSLEKNTVFEEITIAETITIDAIVNEIGENIDYLYINIDSAEYYALLGALNTLQNKSVSVIEVEVYLNEYYEGQPLFSEVDKLMKANSYELLSLRNPNIIVPISSPFEIGKEKLIHYNAIYTHNEINENDFNIVLKHISILELLGFPLKAFDIIQKAYKIYKNDKFREVISKVYNEYATNYTVKKTLDIFLDEVKDER